MDLLVLVLILTTALGGSTCYFPNFIKESDSAEHTHTQSKNPENSGIPQPVPFLQIAFVVTYRDFITTKVVPQTSEWWWWVSFSTVSDSLRPHGL